MMKKKRIKDTEIIKLATKKKALVRENNEYDGSKSDRLAGMKCLGEEEEDNIRVCLLTFCIVSCSLNSNTLFIFDTNGLFF